MLETVPTALAHMITRRLEIPTIGIGAGPFCSGQVQVVHDLLGLYPDFSPRHARRFLEGGELVRDAIATYREQVESGEFPTKKESFYMDDRALKLIERMTPDPADDMSEAERVLAELAAEALERGARDVPVEGAGS